MIQLCHLAISILMIPFICLIHKSYKYGKRKNKIIKQNKFKYNGP